MLRYILLGLCLGLLGSLPAELQAQKRYHLDGYHVDLALHQQARRHFWVGDKGGLGCEIGLSMGLPPCQGRICFSHGGWRGSQLKF